MEGLSVFVPDEDVKSPLLPIIDFSAWTSDGSSDRRLEVALDLVAACRRTGFVYISNHGIAASRVEEAFTWAKKFFDLPHEDKVKVARDQDTAIFRGYNTPGLQRVPLTLHVRGGDPDVTGFSPDFNETFDLGSEDNVNEPNKWLPEHMLPGFRQFSNDFHAECWKVAQKILRALAFGLGIEQDSIEKFHSAGGNELSYKHYPAVPSSDFHSHEKERLGSHSDMDSLTLLFQDNCGGLEVETQGVKGEFFPADPVEGTLVMNIGDALMRWSNDSLLSTIHRVQPPKHEKHLHLPGAKQMTRERYSIPYFVTPRLDTMIECLPGCSDETHPAKYPPRTFGELATDYGKLFYPDATVGVVRS